MSQDDSALGADQSNVTGTSWSAGDPHRGDHAEDAEPDEHEHGEGSGDGQDHQ